jgi:hypothetical protein
VFDACAWLERGLARRATGVGVRLSGCAIERIFGIHWICDGRSGATRGREMRDIDEVGVRDRGDDP